MLPVSIIWSSRWPFVRFHRVLHNPLLILSSLFAFI